MIEVNLTSVFLCLKHAVPALLASGGGSIVTLSSVLGLAGGDADFATHAYAVSKGGDIALSRAVAVAYAPRGLRCNVHLPRPGAHADESAGSRATRAYWGA